MGRISRETGSNVPSARRKGKMQIQFAICDKTGQERRYRGLLDSGSTGNLVNKKIVEELKLPTTKKALNWKTQGSGFKSVLQATISNIKLVDYSNKRKIKNTLMAVNPTKSQKYDAIFGQIFMEEHKIDFLFSTKLLRWDGIEIRMGHEDLVPEVFNNETVFQSEEKM